MIRLIGESFPKYIYEPGELKLIPFDNAQEKISGTPTLKISKANASSFKKVILLIHVLIRKNISHRNNRQLLSSFFLLW